MRDARSLGTEAEDRAAAYLQDRGFTIITRRYRARGGEIDLIALDGETLVFVEVKLSRSRSRLPEAALHDTKWSRIRAAARQYLASLAENREVRFDVVAIDPEGIRHTTDANFWVDPGPEPDLDIEPD